MDPQEHCLCHVLGRIRAAREDDGPTRHHRSERIQETFHIAASACPGGAGEVVQTGVRDFDTKGASLRDIRLGHMKTTPREAFVFTGSGMLSANTASSLIATMSSGLDELTPT